MTTTTKQLIAIDFDRTIISDVADIVVRDLVDSSIIPENVKKLHTPSGFIPYMQEIFKILHNNGIRKDDIFEAVDKMVEVSGMLNCLKRLHLNNFDIIIISDSNSELIRQWNFSSGLSNYVSEVFTNHAYFNNDGVLIVQPFHSQSECSISTINLCKGLILQNYLNKKSKQNIVYKNVFYVGDGYHDICPMLRLTKNDFACPRKNFPADKQLYTVAKNVSTNVAAQVLAWHDGKDLLDKIAKNLDDLKL